MKEQLIKQYCRQVKQAMAVPRNISQKIIRPLENSIEEYLIDNPKATMDDLYAAFGTPQYYARESLSFLGNAHILKAMKRQTLYTRLVAGLCVIALALTAIHVLHTYQNTRNANINYIDVTIKE